MKGIDADMTWHNKSIDQVKKELGCNTEKGLSKKEAESRLIKYGKNIISGKKKESLIVKFIDQFKDFMIIILLFASAISFGSSLMNGEADYLEPIIILAIVIFNAIIGVVQENKAEKSIEALKKISSPTSLVRRGGQTASVNAEDLVPGDVVILKAGDRVSADARLIISSSLMSDESMLSGESLPAEKSADAVCSELSPLAERRNMVWSGSMIVSGKGEAIVVGTGMQTEMGNIARLIISAEERQTPLQRKLSEIGKTLGIGALLICAVIFVIGIFNNIEPFSMFMTSVSLAVAAIPEGLPAIVTIMLAIGVQRMARLGAIVRNLPSVETLGSASVICSDKTGTLTQNKMTVVELSSDDDKKLIKLGAICSDTESVNPTEAAILKKAESMGIIKADLDKAFVRISEIPFDSERKRMSVLTRDKGRLISITKGAPDVVLKLCTHTQRGKALDKETKKQITEEYKKMAKSALRVIAVAYKETTKEKISEEGLAFVGLIGMEDPPRDEVSDAVDQCIGAGITPVMITGDHVDTASAIAKKIGIMSEKSRTMTGEELDLMTQEELSCNIEKYCVFARVTPGHKARIVKAWQKRGAVVAMTGDGVNDAPALKCADIGCSMGMSGTDVAKNASDIILTDDNFATIVKAVRQGRGIFANIKKAVHFLLSSNIGEIMTVFLGLLFGWETPLLAMQLLWINLVTDSLPAIALGLDPPDKYLMKNPPRPRDKSIFADGLWLLIILEGAFIGALALVAFLIGRVYYDVTTARTMAFCVLSLSQLIHAFNVRSDHSVFSIGIFSNKYLLGAFLVGAILQCSVVSIPTIAGIFKVTPLISSQWVIVGAFSILPLLVAELQKFINNKQTLKRPKKFSKKMADIYCKKSKYKV